MKEKLQAEFIIKIPMKQYTKELQKMFDYLRHRKVTTSSKATQKEIDAIVENVRKKRKEKIEAMQYL